MVLPVSYTHLDVYKRQHHVRAGGQAAVGGTARKRDGRRGRHGRRACLLYTSMLGDMLLRAGVPYRIVGGTRFFDRAEIRDVMAYLTLVVNHDVADLGAIEEARAPDDAVAVSYTHLDVYKRQGLPSRAGR